MCTSLFHFTQFSLSIYLSTYLHYIVAYFMLRLCSSLGLLFAMLFIFPLPFRASDCVHNFLPIFIVCLVVYFAVHNLCLGSSTPLSAPLYLCSCSCLFVLCRFPNSTPASWFSSSSYALLSSLWRRHFLRFLRLSSVSTLGSGARSSSSGCCSAGPRSGSECPAEMYYVRNVRKMAAIK